MDAVRFRIFADIRRGLVSWLVLSIVCGLLLSLSLGSAADARWGWAALPRSLRALNSGDLIVFADRQSMDVKTIDRFLTAAERVPSVGGSSRVSAVNLLEVGPDGAFTKRFDFGSAVGKLQGTQWVDGVARLRRRSGRVPAPDRADEVMVNPEFVRLTGTGPGDVVTTLRFYRFGDNDQDGQAIPSKGERLRLRIVGVGERPDELFSAPRERKPQVYLSQAFATAHPDPWFYAFSYLKLRRGATLKELKTEIGEVAAKFPGATIEPRDLRAVETTFQRALRPQIVALWLLSAVAFLAGVIISVQSIGRQAVARFRDLPALRALGMTQHGLAFVVGGYGASVAVAAGAVASMTTYGVSPWLPTGDAAASELRSGFRFDPLIMGWGSLAVVATLCVATIVPAVRLARAATRSSGGAEELAGRDRPSRIVELLARTGAPPTVVTGARFALQPGRGRTATPVRGVLATATAAMALIALALGFSSNLDHLVRELEPHGWNWDAAVMNSFGSIPDDAVDAIRGKDEVGGIAGFNTGTVRIGGHDVPGIGIDFIEGTVFLPLDEGRVPQSANEIVLGRRTLRDSGRSVGDEITVTTRAGRRTVRVVGVATFPGLGFDSTGLGRGAATVASVFPLDDPTVGGRYQGVLIRLDPTRTVDARTRSASIASLRSYVAKLGCVDSSCFRTDALPAQLRGYARLRSVWAPFALVLGLILVISLTHGLITTIRLRGRDLATLRALGLDPRQTGAVVGWQAFVMTVVPLVFGLPLGLIASGLVWRAFTDDLGIGSLVALPTGRLVGIGLSAVALTAIVGLACSPLTRRARLASVRT